MKCIILLAGFFALLSACSGGDEEETSASPASQSPTVRPGPTPSGGPTPIAIPQETGGFDGFQAFAPSIDTAIQAGKSDLFLARASLSTVTCPNEFEPMCVGLADGSTVEGVWQVFWQSEGYLLTLDNLETALAELVSTSPQPALLAIAGNNAEGIVGGPAYFAVVGPRGSNQPLRALEFAFADGDWRLIAIMDIPAGAAGEWLRGTCTDCYDQFQSWTEPTPDGS